MAKRSEYCYLNCATVDSLVSWITAEDAAGLPVDRNTVSCVDNLELIIVYGFYFVTFVTMYYFGTTHSST